MKFACWKIIVIIIDYTLNNFTSLYDDNFIVDHVNTIVDHGKNNNFKNKKKNYSFGGKKIILSIVETDPRLG